MLCETRPRPMLGARASVPATLAPATIASPDLARFRAISDKGAVLAAAREVGLAVPEQVTLESPRSAVTLAGLTFPLVVKPSRSVGGAGSDRRKLGVRHAATEAELRAILAGLPPAAWPVLLQRRIVGPGVGIFLLVWQGRVVAQFAHRRLREKPPSGGVSTYRESIPADPVLVERSRALLERFRWEGAAMVEYKVDAATGTPYLMEVNGRFWGSLQLAIDAGVDFPRLWLELLRGGDVNADGYSAGATVRWLWGDVKRLLHILRGPPPGYRGPYPSRADGLRELFARQPAGTRIESWQADDPWPFVGEFVGGLYELIFGGR